VHFFCEGKANPHAENREYALNSRGFEYGFNAAIAEKVMRHTDLNQTFPKVNISPNL
jgi:hypothetical protein